LSDTWMPLRAGVRPGSSARPSSRVAGSDVPMGTRGNRTKYSDWATTLFPRSDRDADDQFRKHVVGIGRIRPCVFEELGDERETVVGIDVARVAAEQDVRDHQAFHEVATAEQHPRRLAIGDGERGRSVLEKYRVEHETVAADDRRVHGGDDALHACNDIAR